MSIKLELFYIPVSKIWNGKQRISSFKNYFMCILNLYIKYFKEINVISNLKILLFRMFYNALVSTFNKKQSDRSKGISKKKRGIIPLN